MEGELNEKMKDPLYAAKVHLPGAETERDDLREELRQANIQIRAFEDAKVKDLEALMDLLETLAPFYLHGKALRNADIGNIAPLKEISKCGVSALVGGAFSGAIECYEKWGEIANAFVDEKRISEEACTCKPGAPVCDSCLTGGRTVPPKRTLVTACPSCGMAFEVTGPRDVLCRECERA